MDQRTLDQRVKVMQWIIETIDGKIEEFSTAYEGTPEEQMEALQLLCDMRDQLTAKVKRLRG